MLNLRRKWLHYHTDEDWLHTFEAAMSLISQVPSRTRAVRFMVVDFAFSWLDARIALITRVDTLCILASLVAGAVGVPRARHEDARDLRVSLTTRWTFTDGTMVNAVTVSFDATCSVITNRNASLVDARLRSRTFRI